MRKVIFPLTWFWLCLYSILPIFSSQKLSAQKLFFEQLTTAEGLPSDYINTIFEDSKGFLWIGTDKGACSYKGKNFSYYNKDNGLSSNFINCITEDPKGNIWFGTFEGGLCMFDGKKISIPAIQNKNGFKNVFDIVFNKDGSLFLEADSFHLYFLENENAAAQRISTKGPSFISILGEDRFLISSSNNSVSILEKIGGHISIHEIWHTKGKSALLLAKPIHGRFLAQEEGGISIYEVQEKNANLYRQIRLPESLPQGYEKTFYSNGKEIWIASYNGLLYLDKSNNQHYFGVEKELGGNYVNNIYEDSEKNIYICTFGGGIKIWPQSYLQEFPLDGKVISIFPTAKGAYLTTTKNVYHYLPDNNVNLLKNLSFDNFSSFYESGNGKVYLGTYRSFFRLPRESLLYDINKNTRNKYEIFTHVGISGFLEKEDGRLFTSLYGGGVYVFDRMNRIVDSFTTRNNRVSSGMIEFIKPLRNSIAALTYGSGLTLMESNGHSRIIEKRDGLLSNSVYSVFQDSGNKIWIGTLNGVSVYDGRKIVRTYSYVNGLIGSKVLCIFRDPQMRLWILTDKYLHLVEKNNLRAIRSQPVLFDNKNSINRAEYDTLTGNLYLGLTDALVIVQVNKIIPDTIVHSPKLYSVIMGDSSLNLDRQHYTASAGFPKLVFQFANQQSPFGHRSDIYYKLTGYNDEWQLLDNSGELTYEKLPQGNYNLWAKTINPDGYSSPETLLAKFDILPPFWRRGWFLSLSLLLLLSVVFYLGNKYSRIQYEKRIRHLQEVYQIQMERERIARELHDNVGSQLTYLINKIEDEHSLLADKDEAEKLGRFARDTMRELRETIWALDKKEVLPEELEVKVRQLLQLYKDDHRIIELSWEYDNAAQIKLKSLEALNIYRVIQEALNNGVKYSGASLIRISAHFFRAGMSISIEDNGKGFDAAQIENGYGFPNMQKRVQEMNGALVIEGRPGKGTQVSFRIG